MPLRDVVVTFGKTKITVLYYYDFFVGPYRCTQTRTLEGENALELAYVHYTPSTYIYTGNDADEYVYFEYEEETALFLGIPVPACGPSSLKKELKRLLNSDSLGWSYYHPARIRKISNIPAFRLINKCFISPDTNYPKGRWEHQMTSELNDLGDDTPAILSNFIELLTVTQPIVPSKRRALKKQKDKRRSKSVKKYGVVE